MLKTNNKKVKEKIRAYIMDGFHAADFESDHGVTVSDFGIISRVILADFERVTGKDTYYYGMPAQARFFGWLQGLPAMVNTDFFLGCNAACDLVAGWLEESETEKNRYSETDAEKLIANLIWRELLNGANGEILTASQLVTLIENIKKGARK